MEKNNQKIMSGDPGRILAGSKNSNHDTPSAGEPPPLHGDLWNHEEGSLECRRTPQDVHFNRKTAPSFPKVGTNKLSIGLLLARIGPRARTRKVTGIYRPLMQRLDPKPNYPHFALILYPLREQICHFLNLGQFSHLLAFDAPSVAHDSMI